MRRYFFPVSRAHHALNNAVDFGMEFEKRNGKWDAEALLHISGAGGYKIYVHPDSLHLIEPQDGDKDEDGYRFSAATGWWLWSGEDQHGKLHVFNGGFGKKTAIRNGLRFHYPDQEPG